MTLNANAECHFGECILFWVSQLILLWWMSLWWVSLWRVSLWWVSLWRVSLWWVSLCWVSLWWMSWRPRLCLSVRVKDKIFYSIFTCRSSLSVSSLKSWSKSWKKDWFWKSPKIIILSPPKAAETRRKLKLNSVSAEQERLPLADEILRNVRLELFCGMSSLAE